MKNIMNVDVSLFRTITSKTPEIINLYEWLTFETYKPLVQEIRNCRDEQEKKRLKALLPAITPSGIFTGRKADNLEIPSSFICIDIDKKDNQAVDNFSDLKKLIGELECVAYCGLSASGEGYFALIPIVSSIRHKEHFRHLQKAFENCGITIDSSCCDINRLRFASYDDTPYINREAIPYDKIILVKSSFEVKKVNDLSTCSKQRKDVEELIEKIELLAIDITQSYKRWFAIGCSLAKEFGEDGRKLFHRISRFYKGYNIDETEKQYSACLGYEDEDNKFSIGTLFYYAQKSGIIQNNNEKYFNLKNK